MTCTVRTLVALLTLFVALWGTSARADIQCNAEKDSFTFQYGAGRDGLPPSGPLQQTCKWKNGTTVLVHYLSTGASDNVSIWVNRAKWVKSALLFEYKNYEHDYDKTTRIDITEQGLTLCTIGIHATGEDEDEATRPESCTTQAKSSLPATPDPVEFPEPNKQRLEPPATRVINATDTYLCSGVMTYWVRHGAWVESVDGPSPGGFMDDGHKIEVRSVGDPAGYQRHTDQGAEIFSYDLHPFRWDVNNMKRPLWVDYTSERSHQINEDIYYAFDDDDLKHFNASNRTLEDLARYATSVYPSDWLKCLLNNGPVTNRVEVGCRTGNGLSTFSALDLDGLTVQLQSGSILMVPIAYNGSNYFVLLSDDHILFVVKPLPDRKYEVACTLEKVQLNM